MVCNVGDLAIYYETYGSGRPMVMLPGRPSDHRVMARFMEPVFTQREGWLRIYPDLPGTGRTPSADRLATHDAMLEAVLAVIGKGIPGQRFGLAGVSHGGDLARGRVYLKAAAVAGGTLRGPHVRAQPGEGQRAAR